MSFLKSFDKQQLFIETYEGLSTDTDMVVRLVQPPNAPQSISVTPSGITIPVRPVQPLNAELMITVTLFGITILVRPVQPLKARDGVMSVLGNHDYTYYMDVDDEQEIAA